MFGNKVRRQLDAHLRPATVGRVTRRVEEELDTGNRQHVLWVEVGRSIQYPSLVNRAGTLGVVQEVADDPHSQIDLFHDALQSVQFPGHMRARQPS